MPLRAVQSTALPLKDSRLFRQQCYIDGAWADADSGKTIEVTNPATDEVLGTIPEMGAGETRRAIAAADKAWPAWRAKTAKERAKILRKWFDLMMENQDDLAVLMTAEQGKPLAESKRRDRLRRLLRRVVRRGGQADLWRHQSRSTSPTSASW
jgi:succinate-semialdehyde dehydrogenase/glutarate-semialdehyde dehydrogenase